MKTKIDCKVEKNRITIEVAGEINAQTDFPNLSHGDVNELIIDMNGLGYMNSGGVKSWVSWIGNLNVTFRGSAITFVNLPPISARQASQIREFLPNGANISSFVVPYYCEVCQKNTVVLFKKGQNWDSSWEKSDKIRKLSKTPCGQCGSPAEIDALPEHYLNF